MASDYDPAEFDVLSDEEASRALYRPSRAALELQQKFLRDQERDFENDQSSWMDRVALGFGQGMAGLESAAGGLYSLFGATDTGDYIKQDARRRQAELEDAGDTLGYDVISQAGQGFTRDVVGSALPSIAGAYFGGLPGAIAVGALQSAGSVQDIAQQAYEARGLDREEAISKSRLPAIASGLITAALTRAMPGGVERLSQMMLGNAASRGTAREVIFSTAREALKEFPEEAADQLAQDVVARFSYDPEKPIGEIVTDALHAGALGSGIGLGVGAVGATAEGTRRLLDRQPVTGAAIQSPQGYTMPNAEFEVIEEPPFVPDDIYAETDARRREREPLPPGAPRQLAPAAVEDEFEVIAEPDTPALLESAEDQPVIDLEPVRQRLLENMQTRSMDISPADFSRADPHLQSVLGPSAPSWQQLADAGLIQATTNPNNTVSVRVAPEAAVAPAEVESAPAPAPAVPPPSPPKPPATTTSAPAAFTAETEITPDVKINLAAQFAQPEGEARRIVQHVYQNANEIVATNGRIMLIVDQPNGPKTEVLHKGGAVIENNKGGLRYPDYKKIIPKKFKGSIKSIPTGPLLSNLEKLAPPQESPIAIELLKNPDGSFGFSIPENEVAENVQDGAKLIGSFDANYLNQGVTALRSLGNASIRLDYIDDLSPLVLQGKSAKVIIMPMRMSSFVDAAELTPSAAEIPATSPQPAATGQEGIASLVETSNLAPRVKAVMQALLKSPALQNLDLASIQLEITRLDQQGSLTELGARIGNLIQLSEQANEQTFAHEMAHVLFDTLPAEVKAQIEAARKTAIPPGSDERLASGAMTSREFADSGLPVDLYPLTNASEFLAHSFADTFARKAIAASDPSLLGKLKTWLTELYAAIKGAIGLGSSMDRIVNDLINGRFTPTSQTGLATETSVRQSTFVTSEAEAQNAAQLAADKKVEGESLLAQGADIAALLDRFNLGSAPGMVQQAFDFQNWTALRDIGAQLNQGLETYQQLKARFAINSFRRARLAGEAGQQILRFGEMLDFAIKGGQIALQTLSGPRLKSLVNKVQSAALSAIAADQLLTVSKSVFNAALHQATVALSEQARTDLQMAQLQGQIRNLQQASESSVAIEQLLNDMVAVLNSTTEGRAALFTGQGGATRVRSIYADIKKSKGESLHSENLLHWASFILNQSPKLRDALQAAHLAKQSGLRSRLTGFQKKFSDDLNTDPEKTIRKAMRERENQVADKTGAEFLFRQLQESLLEEVEPLVAAADAGAIAAQIKADPQFNALRKEILNDQTSFGGKPAKPFKSATLDGADTVITLPSGRTLGIGHETMDGNQATLRARWDEYNAAVIELENWIANPLNADDPNRRLHEANLQTLQDYYTGQQALMPENRDPIFKHAFSIINIAIAKTASRLSGSARAAVQRMDQMNKWARDWNDRATHALASSQRAAMLSHGIKWNNLTGRSIVQANRLYQQRVGQELAASWQRQEGGLNVGDILSSGEKVTAADIAHLEAQSKAGVESLNIAAKYDRQITEDARGLKTGPNYRHALRTSPYLLPRMFDYSLEMLARNVSEAIADPTALESALDRIWPAVGLSMLVDRNAEFAKKTLFDGPGGAFEAVATQMRQNPSRFQTVDQVADAIAQHSTTTKDEAKQVLLTEFGRIIKNWSDAVQEKIASAGNGPKTGDAKNSFTQARGDALAPWTFYRTGFTTSDDVANHAAGLQSVALDRVVDAMEALEKDLARQESEFRLRSDQLDRQGVPNASAAAIREKEEQRRQKQTYDSWENLRESKTHISRVLSRLRERGLAESDFDYTFGRGAGALVGALIGNVVTTMRNLSSIFFGRQLRALGMGHLNSLLQGMAFTGYEALKIMGSLALGLPRAGFFLIRGMGRGVPQLLKGEARAAYHSALRDVIRELAEDVPRRLTTVRDLEASGLYSLPDRVKEFDNQILGSILYRGRIPAAELSGKAKAFGYATAAAEASFLAVANAAFPTVGDAGINAAMYSVLNSSIGPLHSMETRLRKVFNDWKKNNYRKFDFQNPANPANRLLAREAGVNENDLSIMRRTYEMAGLSFDTEAVKFIAELNSGNTKAQFLANDARLSLGDAMINQMNRAAFGNAPLSLKQGGTFVKFFRPLYGFPVRAFADWESTLSVPSTTDSDTARMRLWFQAMSSVMLGLLLTGAGGQLKDEAVARLLKRALFNQESPNKLPWEEDSFPRALANTTRLAMESVPLLGIIGNLIIPANSPARASYEPTIAVYESGAAAARYVANVVSTGDPTHGLPELIAKFVPDAKAVINRLPSQSGRRESANVVAEIKRFAPSDVVREPFARGSGGRIASKMAPHIEDMDNYAMKGDTRKFLAAHRAAVNAARQMGKADPEKTVQNAFRSRNPYTRALQRQMTTSERTQTLRRAGRQPGANLRKDIELAERRYNAAAALIGIGSSNFTQRPRVGSTRSSQPSRSVPRVSTSLRRSPGSFYSQSRQSGSRSLSRFY